MHRPSIHDGQMTENLPGIVFGWNAVFMILNLNTLSSGGSLHAQQFFKFLDHDSGLRSRRMVEAHLRGVNGGILINDKAGGHGQHPRGITVEGGKIHFEDIAINPLHLFRHGKGNAELFGHRMLFVAEHFKGQFSLLDEVIAELRQLG